MNASFKQYVLGEIYDVDSNMLKRLDELEEHPKFYERTEEKILLALEAALKPGKTFEEVIRWTYARAYRVLTNATGICTFPLTDQFLFQVAESTKAWIYFLPRYKSSLLDGAMYVSYTNNGSHGLKYCEKYVRDPSYDHRMDVQ